MVQESPFMPDFRRILARYFGLPLKAAIKREPFRRVLRELEANQWLSKEQLEAIRRRRLRHLLIAVSRNVPFYRDQIRSLGADPYGDDPWRILNELPTLDKRAYRSLGAALRSERARRAPMIGHTSGTTGERLETYLDRTAATYAYVANVRGRRWWGIEPGDSELKIWGGSRYTARTRAEWIRETLRLAKDWLIGVTLVSPFLCSDDDLQRAATLLLRRKPRFVFGYANSIYLLASYMVRQGLAAGPGWPHAVGYAAEMLHDWQLEVIRQAFSAPVVSEYGSCEAGLMACMCPHGSLHTSDDVMHIEIVHGNGNVKLGELGEVVVTNLLALEYPLIRYRQGDLASLSATPCECGRSLGVMDNLVGRMNDVLVSPAGGLVDFIVFDKAMKDQPAIRRFKVVERGPGDLVVLSELHAGIPWPEKDRSRFLTSCRALLPADVTLEVRLADRLPPEPSGKFRIMIPREQADRYL